MDSDNTPNASSLGGETVECFSVPASFGQRRMWFLDRYQPKLSVYNIAFAWRIRGPLDATALRRTFEDLVARHESLRTTFDFENGTPIQVIVRRHSQPLSIETMPPGSDLEERIRGLVLEESEDPFELAKGPLLRVRLVQITDQEHVLMLTMHHAISDLWSMAVISKELWALYGAHIEGRPSPLPELPIQYADFSVWQREMLQGERLERLLAFWRTYLDGAPNTLDLPTDHVRPPSPTYRGDWVDIELDADRSETLRSLARRLEITVFMAIAALFEVLLYRSSGQKDVLVGYPVSARNHSDLEGLIGLFVNTLVLRARFGPEMSFVDVAGQVKEGVLDGHAHQDLPFENLVDDLQPERDPSRHPLFQVAYGFIDADQDQFRLPGLDLSLIQNARRTSKFDLTLFFSERRGYDLWGGFEFSTDLFERKTIEGLALRFKTLLDAVVAAPETPLDRLNLLPDEERRRVLHTWNPTPEPLPSWYVHQRVEQLALDRPDATAVRGPDFRISYSQLNSQADRLAGRLRGMGVRTGQAVALCVERSATMVVGMLGILKAGAAYVPFEPELPAARFAYMTADLGISVIVTTARWTSLLPGDAARLVLLDLNEATSEALPMPVRVEPMHPAYCIYTSGSTGGPKAVAVPHQALSALMSWHHERYRIGPSQRNTQVASFGFDACTWEVWSSLTAGSTLFIVDDATRGEPERLLEFLAENQVTHCFLPTPLAEAILAISWPPSLALQSLLTGGDQLHFAPGTDRPVELVNHYGPTECTVVATAGRVEVDVQGLPPIGRPITGARTYILDERGEPVPIGVPGELYIAGVGVALGYSRRPRLTALSFLPDPFGETSGGRMYRTGDAARYRADGSIEFLGRLDRQIKLRGYRIEPAEIEAALVQHPTVRRCVVELSDSASGRRRLTAFVESDIQAHEGTAIWRRHLEELLPGYMLPEVLVPLDRLPQLSSGKLDRMALKQTGHEDPVLPTAYVPPRDELERKLAAIWTDLLSVARVGMDDDFFVLGGQSLLVIQVIARIRTEIGVELRVRDLFENPTVAQLRDCIERHQWLGESGLDDDAERETGEL